MADADHGYRVSVEPVNGHLGEFREGSKRTVSPNLPVTDSLKQLQLLCGFQNFIRPARVKEDAVHQIVDHIFK